MNLGIRTFLRKIITKKKGKQKQNFINLTNLLDENFINDPYPSLKEMLSQNPVQFFEKHNYWQILNYDGVNFALKNPEIFSSIQGKGLDPVLLGAEPIDHLKSRRVLAPYFSTKVIEDFSKDIKKEAETILCMFSGREIDIVNDYSIPITEKIIANFIGLTEKELKEVQSILDSQNRYELTYFKELENYFSKYLDSFNFENKKTFCSKILKNKEFNKEELTSILKLLWIAGTTTTSMLISSSVFILLKNSKLLNKIKNDFSKIDSFIDEVLRFESPEKTSWRTTLKNIELSGTIIPENSNVHLYLSSANRDPKYFDNPNEFNIERTNRKNHLAFAAGAHYCIGAQLARLEAKIALEVLINMFPNIKLLTPEEDIKYFKSSHFRALESLKVILKK